MRIAELNPAWLAAALEVTPSRISGLRADPVGTGQVADTYRLCFAVDEAERSLILKLTSDDQSSRQTGRQLANYLREVRYYQHLADTLNVRAPKCWHTEISGDGMEFALLLEDMTPCRPGDQLAGCTVEQVELVLEEAAKLHAARWADPTLAELSWLPGIDLESVPGPEVFDSLFARFRKRYDGRVDDDVLAVGTEFFAHIDAFFHAQHAAPWTVAHGDFRPDNILFAGAGGSVPVTVVDWQTVQRGPALLDVSYFIGGALSPDIRRSHERSLLARYHAALCRRGVRDYSIDDCWRDYVTFSLQNYLVGVGAAMIVKQTDRGDRMFLSMVERSARHALDLNALDILAKRHG